MTDTTTAEPQDSRIGAALIAQVLDRRSHVEHSGWLASVRRGITAASEVGSYGATGGALADVRGESAKTGARRAAAMCAAATGSPQDKRRVGAALALLHQRTAGGHPGDKPSSITSTVNSLALLDQESAALALSGLIGRCSGEGIGLDFYHLADTLARWGQGLTPSSRRVRERIVADYYSAPNA